MTLPTGKGYTAAQWEAYLAANTSPLNPDYTGTAVLKNGAPLKGKTWAQVYAAFYAENTGQTPDQIAVDVEALGFEEALAVGTSGVVTGAANATEAAAQGTAKGAASIVPSWADGLATFLSDITSQATWLRVAKVVVGSAMIIVGLANITGAGKVVSTAAKGAIL
jgi:hypothetical protein